MIFKDRKGNEIDVTYQGYRCYNVRPMYLNPGDEFGINLKESDSSVENKDTTSDAYSCWRISEDVEIKDVSISYGVAIGKNFDAIRDAIKLVAFSVYDPKDI